jgi:hypothetical protein
MTIPNMFIIGAPKCGTTSLYYYLNTHPDVFMPDPKEPHFFADDYARHRVFHSMESYLALFASAATDRYTAIGEASVHYIHSRVAIQNIYQFNPSARIIAMFRNPVQLVHSYHSQNVFSLYDDVKDFEQAWHLQAARRQGEHIPRSCKEPALLQYEHIGRLGTHAQNVINTFPRDQIKLILFDDFVASPKTVYEDVLRFLELPLDGREHFPPINQNKTYRSALLQAFVKNETPSHVRRIQKLIGIRGSFIKRYMGKWNTQTEKRSPLSAQFRSTLVETYRDEVNTLAGILDRDLSRWLEDE